MGFLREAVGGPTPYLNVQDFSHELFLIFRDHLSSQILHLQHFAENGDFLK